MTEKGIEDYGIATRLRSNSAVACLLLLNIFLFGVFSVYKGNADEIGVPFWASIKYFSIPFIIALSTIVTIGMFVPSRFFHRYTASIFALGLLVWFQGNVLVWKYGLLDGHGIDWTVARWRGWVDGGIWAIALALAWAYSKRIEKIASFASIALISVQAVILAFHFTASDQEYPSGFKDVGVAPQWVSGFSKDINVIQFVLDGFQSDAFEEIVRSDTDFYDQVLDGFTFFRNNTASFPTTYLSVPMFMSGRVYQNEMPIHDFFDEVYGGKTIANELYDNEYAVDLVLAGHTFDRGKSTNSYVIPDPYVGTVEEYEKFKAALLFDMMLFRHSPHSLKPSIYREQKWLFQGLFAGDEQMPFRRFGHEKFLGDVIRDMSITRSGPVFKFYHLLTSHTPFVTIDGCGFSGEVLPHTRENMMAQLVCSLDQFVAFIQKLKELGLYDNSVIVLHADHGSVVPVEMYGGEGRPSTEEVSPSIVASAAALLAVKPLQSSGGLEFSDAPTMLADIPATFSDLLSLDSDFPGVSAFKIGETRDRERSFFAYRWKHANWQAEFLPPMIEYTVSGSIFDRDAWRFARKQPIARGISFATERLDFGTDVARDFLRHGWGGNEKSEEGMTFVWAMGSSASVFLSLPRTGTVKLSAQINSIVFPRPQVITVKVDGDEVGTWELLNRWEWQDFEVALKASENRPEVSVIEFLFSETRDSEGGKRPLAALFESLAVSEGF